MGEIAIRVAGPNDVAGMAAVHETAVGGERGGGTYDDELIDAWAHALTLAELRERLAARRFFIAESPSEPIAYAQLDLDAASLRSLYVSPAYRRQGVGRRLAETAIEATRAAGLRRLELDSSFNAVSFYEALGSRRLGRIEHRLHNGVVMPCVRMAKELGTEAPVPTADDGERRTG